jgi:hypothetical protein
MNVVTTQGEGPWGRHHDLRQLESRSLLPQVALGLHCGASMIAAAESPEALKSCEASMEMARPRSETERESPEAARGGVTPAFFSS